MSRRASLFNKEAKEHPEQVKSKPRVRFPDELVFLDNIKENDVPAMSSMLRRASIQIDINGIADHGMTPLHQAVVDENLTAVQLLVNHGADINKVDIDSWTPLHAACANGCADIAKFLLENGSDKNALTEDGERPLDLVEPDDFPMIQVMLGHGQPMQDDDEEDEEDPDCGSL